MMKKQLTLTKIKPTEKQKIVWKKLLDNSTEYITWGSGAGVGKTWLGCEWELVMSLRYPGTRYFIGRNELKQIRETVLPTFYKVLRFYEIPADTVLKYNAQDHVIQFHNGSRIDLLDLQYLPSDPFFDEGAFDTLKSRIGRGENDKHKILGKILLTCNPKKVWLYYNFYLPWKKGTLDKNKAFVPATIDDNPYIDSGYKQKLESITDTIKRERLLHGNWEYSEEAGQLIPNEYINDALEGNASLVEQGERFISADIARFGSDNTVIVLWSGLRAEQIFIHPHLSTTESAAKIRELQERYNVSIRNVIADEDGVGGGVVDTLGCVGFLNGSKPIEVNYKVDNYANLKTQSYYVMAELMREKKMYVNYSGNTEIKNKLIQELEQVRLKDSDTENKISILSKKEVKQRIGRSPDIADAIMMRVYFELKPQGQGTFWGGYFTRAKTAEVLEERRQSSYNDNSFIIGSSNSGRRR
jgi:phage terminase large subunit